MDGEGEDGGRRGRCSGNVPFEFVGEVARAGAVAKARDVEGGAAAARHVRLMLCLSLWCATTQLAAETSRVFVGVRGGDAEMAMREVTAANVGGKSASTEAGRRSWQVAVTVHSRC